MATVTFSQLRKVYSNGFEAVHGLDLTIADGEFMVFVGPSGCGKTTALRMVAGLEDISSGDLRIGDRLVNDVPPKDRDVAMVFQNYALYPHMTVAENIGFALKVARVPKAEANRKIHEAASILGLNDWLDRKPGQLSGGQRQRVAMGRAIVREPAVFLMDEPLSNLDAKLRVQMRAEVSRIQHNLGVSTIYVTHDQVEAMTMGDRVAVMCAGHLQQCDTAQALYKRPVNLFVASFIGSPAMNLYQGTLNQDVTEVKLGSQTLVLPDQVAAAHPELRAHGGRGVVVGLRPEHLSVAVDEAVGPALKGDVDLVEELGSELMVHFKIDAVNAYPGGAPLEDDEGPRNGGQGVARVGPDTPVRGGERVRFAVNVDGLQFFDPATEKAIW